MSVRFLWLSSFQRRKVQDLRVHSSTGWNLPNLPSSQLKLDIWPLDHLFFFCASLFGSHIPPYLDFQALFNVCNHIIIIVIIMIDDISQSNLIFAALWGNLGKGRNCDQDKRFYRETEAWCQWSHLQIHAGKTLELVVDFHWGKLSPSAPLRIQGRQIVDSHRYLGGHWADLITRPRFRADCTCRGGSGVLEHRGRAKITLVVFTSCCGQTEPSSPLPSTHNNHLQLCVHSPGVHCFHTHTEQ